MFLPRTSSQASLFAASSNLNSTEIRKVSSTRHVAKLEPKAVLTLMTNLGQACHFSYLITLVQ